jgi:hypothetical protein
VRWVDEKSQYYESDFILVGKLLLPKKWEANDKLHCKNKSSIYDTRQLLCDDFQLSFKSDSGTMTHERVYRKRHALLNCISMLSSVFMFYVVIHNYSCFTCKNSTRQLLAMISSFGGTMTRERVSLLGLSRLLILHVIS